MLLCWNKDVMHSANDTLKETALQVETLTEGSEGLAVGGESFSLGDAIGAFCLGGGSFAELVFGINQGFLFAD